MLNSNCVARASAYHRIVATRRMTDVMLQPCFNVYYCWMHLSRVLSRGSPANLADAIFNAYIRFGIREDYWRLVCQVGASHGHSRCYFWKVNCALAFSKRTKRTLQDIRRNRGSDCGTDCKSNIPHLHPLRCSCPCHWIFCPQARQGITSESRQEGDSWCFTHCAWSRLYRELIYGSLKD